MTYADLRRTLRVAAIAALPLLAAHAVLAQNAELRPLQGVEELKSWFNANREHPRVVFLLSPT